MLRTAIAFVKKEFLINLSYRFNFITQIVTIFFITASLYYIGKLVSSTALPFLEPYGGSFFGFLMIGVALADYTGVSINSFSGNIRDGQLTGTLEVILASPTRLFVFLLSSSLWGYIFTTLRLLVYFLVGTMVFRLNIENANILAAIIILILSILCYMSIGIIFASLILVVKKGESAMNVVGGVLMILSGVFFPSELLPVWIVNLTKYIPFTYSLHGLRFAMLKGYPIGSLIGDVIALCFFALIFSVISAFTFPYAVKRAKIDGSLTQY